MENQSQNHSEDRYAKNEPQVEPFEILAEITPLIKDYFEGEILFDGRFVTYCLPNGQKFKLFAEEAA